jgi:molecular chaperone GrpE
MNEKKQNKNVSPLPEEGQGEEGAESSCESCTEHLDGWKRALADYDNLKKDLVKERGAIREAVKEDVAQQLISVLDNFDQAARFQPEGLTGEAQTWLSGLMHVRNQLEGVMTELGLESFGGVGERFDPNLHEAAAEQSESDKADQEILEVSMRGWKMSGGTGAGGKKIVRPAKVVVNLIK